MFWSVEDQTRIIQLKRDNARMSWDDISQYIDERHNSMACRKRFLESLPVELKVKMSLAQRRLVCKMLAHEAPASYEEISKALLPDQFKPDDIKNFYDLVATDKEIARGYRDAQSEESKTGSRPQYVPTRSYTTIGTSTARTPGHSKTRGASPTAATKETLRTVQASTSSSGDSGYVRRNPRYWSKEEEQTLLEMYVENKTWQEIANVLSVRSVGACRSKFQRMDINVINNAKRKREETLTSSKGEPIPKKLRVDEEEDKEKQSQQAVSSSTGPITRHKARLSKSEQEQ